MPAFSRRSMLRPSLGHGSGRLSYGKARAPAAPYIGLRNTLRLAFLLLIGGFICMWVLVGKVAVTDPTAAEAEHDSSLRRLFFQHGEEIQSSIRSNWVWFRHYLTKLRLSSRGVSPDEEEEDERSDERRLTQQEGMHGSQEGGQTSKKLRPRIAKSRDLPDSLNNMDMPTHKVHGKLQPCLKLLPEAELATIAPPSPRPEKIKRLSYYHLDQDAIAIEESTGAVDKGRTVALDMFAGKQTMGERAESFKLQNEMEVHCGFAGTETGFDISKEDQEFLNHCKLAVVTAAFGAGDMLAQPIGMTETSRKKVCYVAFWDAVTLKAQEADGVKPDPATGLVGLWRVVVVNNLPFVDQRRNGKIPKMLIHRLLPNVLYSIWVDSKYQFRRDPIGVFEALLWRHSNTFAISEHGARSCVYAEGEAIVRKHKATPEEVAIQLNQYRTEGLPVNATFHGRKALAEASIIVREHNNLTNLFMCLWFNENVRFTSRDQLSFGYVLRRMKLLRPYLFPVCTRRALVNKLGHQKKAKPLS